MARSDNVAQLRKQADGELWKAGLRPSNKGYIGDELNVQHALRNAPDLQGLVRFNAFALDVEVTGALPWRQCPAGSKWLETDDTGLQIWLQRQDINVRGRATVADAVALVALDVVVHPVRDYLDALTWDGEPRLKIWLSDYLNAGGNQPYLAAIGQAFLISAVARIQQPGCQADHVLVLEAPQGYGKTSAVRAVSKYPSWYAGSLPEIHTKDAALQLYGRWIIELSELKGMRKSDLEAIKAFITETADTFRPPYGRRTTQVPRQCVFIATTNESEYLRDRTGNRRYWPVKCGRVRLDALIADCDQLWAEAMHEYRAGTAWHLTADETILAADEQRARVFVSELEADVAEYLSKECAAGRTAVSVRDVLVYGLGFDPDAPSYAENARKHGTSVADAIEQCGWKKAGRSTSGGSKKRTMYRMEGGQGGQGK